MATKERKFSEHELRLAIGKLFRKESPISYMMFFYSLMLELDLGPKLKAQPSDVIGGVIDVLREVECSPGLDRDLRGRVKKLISRMTGRSK